MATLTSPGVEVSVINESFYVPSDAGTTPLFIVASSQDKQNGAGDGTAAGKNADSFGENAVMMADEAWKLINE